MQFAHPELLALLALLPLWAWLRGRAGTNAALVTGRIDFARAAGRVHRSRWRGLWLGLRMLSAAALIVALARPQAVDAKTEVNASGVDMVLAVDVSGSMEAQDFARDGKPAPRLEIVKEVVRDFVKKRPNDRLGLVAFAGRPFVVSPLTLDHDWLEQNLSRVRVGLVEDGTAVGDAVGLAADRLARSDGKSKIVVLLTDGVSNRGKLTPELAAEAAAALGVRVYTVGAGSDGAAPVAVKDDDGQTQLVRQDVEVDEATLRSVAEATGGRYFRAVDTESLEEVYAAIDKLEKTDRTLTRHVRTEERFHYAAGPAALLLLFELLLAWGARLRLP